MIDAGGNALVYSSSLIAAFLGGVLALFAPCCVVSLMPTFVATALRQGRLRLPLTTLVFAAGVGAVLLPVVWGVGALGHLFAVEHRVVYLVVGFVLLAIGLARSWVACPRSLPTLRYRPNAATGQSTITPNFLVAWLRWSSGLAGTAALLLGRLPVWAQIVLLAALAGGTALAMRVSRPSPSGRHEDPRSRADHALVESGTPVRSSTGE